MQHAIRMAVLLAIGLAACGGGPTAPDEEDPRTNRPGPTGQPSPSPPPRALAPNRAITVDPQRGALTQVEIPTGRFLEEIEADLGDAGLGEGAGTLDHSPARNSVIFSRVLTAANQEIVEVPLDGGRAQVLANGHTAVVGPDGERIAVGRHELGEDDPDRVVLEIRRIDGPVLRRWSDPVSDEEPVRVSQVTWSPDGTRLAFELQFEDGTQVRVLDVTSEGGSLQRSGREVQPSGDLRMLSAPEFRPGEGSLVAVEGPGLDPDAEQRWRIISVDVSSAEPASVLVESDRAITVLDFDHSGRHLLYVEGHAHPPRDPAPPRVPALWYWHDGASTQVAEGLTDAAW